MNFEELTKLYPADGLARSANDGGLCWIVEVEHGRREVPLDDGLQQLRDAKGRAYWYELYVQLERELLRLQSISTDPPDGLLDSMDIVWSHLEEDTQIALATRKL